MGRIYVNNISSTFIISDKRGIMEYEYLNKYE